MEYLILALVGLCMGSFVGATLWRLRARQLHEDKKHNERYDREEYKKLDKISNKGLLDDRSMCLSCSYKLKWYDMIPVISWLMLRGKCRKCHAKIGMMEPLLEIGLASFFVLSVMYWPYQLDSFFEITRLVLWLVSGVGLAILLVYDLKWLLLPDKISFGLIGLGLVNAVITVALSNNVSGAIYSILGAILILSGIYYLLNTLSRGKWVGFGDVKLGAGLALFLGDWQLAFMALFIANLVGCFIVIPLMLLGKLKRNSRVPLGPLLIIGTIIAELAGHSILDWYINTLL